MEKLSKVLAELGKQVPEAEWDKIRPQPACRQIARFLEAFDVLIKFDATQRYVRGYGAFPSSWSTPDPDVVAVRAWLEALAKA